MSMTIQDQVIGALTCWREARGEGVRGMQAVFNVLQNRAASRHTDVYTEAVRRLQFSSMTATGDPNLILYPTDIDAEWEAALTIALQASLGQLEDITLGATSYYAPKGMPDGKAPYWAASMSETIIIGNQIFFKA